MPRKSKNSIPLDDASINNDAGEAAPTVETAEDKELLRKLALIEQYGIKPTGLDFLSDDLNKVRLEVFDTVRLMLHFGAPQHQIAAGKLLLDWYKDFKGNAPETPTKLIINLDDDATAEE